MPVPSQGHYGFHSFPVVDWFCLFIYLWVWLSLCKISRSSVILLLPLMVHSLSWLGTFTFLAWYIHFPGLVHSLSWLGTFTFLAWYIHFPGLVHSLSSLCTFSSIGGVKLVLWRHIVNYHWTKNCFFQSVTLKYYKRK
jgi:uncharacterized membrane protein (DUF485 family)